MTQELPNHHGEPISARLTGIPEHDRGQSLGRRARNKVTAESKRKLPSDYSTVIRDAQLLPTPIGGDDESKTVPLGFTFTVQIGRVLRKDPKKLSTSDKRKGFSESSDHFSVSEGKNAGDVLVVPISTGASSAEKYLINIVGPRRDEIDLILYVNDNTQKVVRMATVEPSLFTENGFDLDPTNPDNKGRELNHELSQELYDFYEGQGRFAPEEKPASPARRALRPSWSSKDRVRQYNLPAIVESNREGEYLDLLENYFALALALRNQDEAEGLKELEFQQLTVYSDAPTSVRRDMEADLKSQFTVLQEEGFAYTLDMITRFRNDAGDSEREVYDYKEWQRMRFASTKKDRKLEMFLALIDEKKRMAVLNLDGYQKIWLRIFPQGPRTNYWQTRLKRAAGDPVALAEISERLRDELGKKLVAQFGDYTTEWQISSVDLGMPIKEAEEKAYNQIVEFRRSPLFIKAKMIEDIEIRADAALLAAYPINTRIWDLLIHGKQRETGEQLNATFDNAPTDGRIRLARKLFKDIRRELEERRKAYGAQIYQDRNKRKGFSARDAHFEANQILSKLVELPTLEQLRIMNADELL